MNKWIKENKTEWNAYMLRYYHKNKYKINRSRSYKSLPIPELILKIQYHRNQIAKILKVIKIKKGKT